MFYEVENKGNMIAGVIGYDSIRKHLAECGYHIWGLREKYYLWRADVYIDIKEQRGQYCLENIMKDKFAKSLLVLSLIGIGMGIGIMISNKAHGGR